MDVRAKQITLELTSKCNYACIYCRGSAGPTEDSTLPIELVKRCLDEAKVFGNDLLLGLSGGEPMLHRRFWDIAAYARALFPKVLLVTNGSLVTAVAARRLAELGLLVTVSLDASDEQLNDRLRMRGSFRCALRAITFLREARVAKMLVNAVITQWNADFDQLSQLAGLAWQAGAEVIVYTPILPSGRGAPEWLQLGLGAAALRRMYESVRYLQGMYLAKGMYVTTACSPLFGLTDLTGPFNIDYGQCGFAVNLSVTANGDVIPCSMARHHVLGNVRSESLLGIFNAPATVALRDKTALSGRCGECPFWEPCGGCRIRAEFLAAGVHDEDPHCWWHPAETDRLSAIELERILKLGRSSVEADRGFSA
jgi:radical SAM protein with 4Fe4S-binding SPASM domain